jgi:phosphoesterase RecJ-like protein
MVSKQVSLETAAQRLLDADKILLLAHQFPDGDTVGSCAGLCLALQTLGKQVKIQCSDPIPSKFAYMTANLMEQEFEPQFICAVDVADPTLLGPAMQQYADKVDLCIDHHGTNVQYAKELLLDPACAAAAMIVFRLLAPLGVNLTPAIAQCLYTGMATDTGCFKYSNTTALTHQMAAECIACGIPHAQINRAMFDIKSRARLELERIALQNMTFHFNGKCAVMTFTNEMIRQSGATENDLEGLPPLARQIEGVWVGVTLREKADGSFKISVRTGEHANAAEICQMLGGGGHPAAAGCTLELPIEQAKEKILETIGQAVPRIHQ